MIQFFLNIFLVFVLCFGFKAQSQNKITDLDTKLTTLSTVESEHLDYFIYGMPSSMFVTYQNEAKLYYTESDIVLKMSIEKSEDFSMLATAFEQKLGGLVVIDIEWDGQSNITIPVDLLSKMKHLRYVYIRSYISMDEATVRSRFQNMLDQLSTKANVEVVYHTMEQPS